MVDAGTISAKTAKAVFDDMAAIRENGGGDRQRKGAGADQRRGRHSTGHRRRHGPQPAEVAAYRGGKAKLMGFFVGEVMKATRGQANPKTVNELLKKKLA